jgi:hypothetical protein
MQDEPWMTLGNSVKNEFNKKVREMQLGVTFYLSGKMSPEAVYKYANELAVSSDQFKKYITKQDIDLFKPKEHLK